MAGRKPRKRKGNWGIFGIRRESVPSRRRKQTLSTLKRRKKERESEERVSELKRKTSETQAEAGYYEAKARKRKAKSKTSRWPSIPTKSVRVKRKKQGKKLSQRSRIRLI